MKRGDGNIGCLKSGPGSLLQELTSHKRNLLDVGPEEMALIGANGAGKTTTLHTTENNEMSGKIVYEGMI